MCFHSRIEMLEACLSVHLDDLTDDYIETLYTDSSLTVAMLNLEGAGDFFFSENIACSATWKPLPLDTGIQQLLNTGGADHHYAFDSIQDGAFVISGVTDEGDSFDFNTDHLDKWTSYTIGIWDANAEELFFIAVNKIMFGNGQPFYTSAEDGENMKSTTILSLCASFLLLIAVVINLLGNWIELAVRLSVVPLILLPIIAVLYAIVIVRIMRSKKK